MLYHVKDSYVTVSTDKPFSSQTYYTKLKYQTALKRLMLFISFVILDVTVLRQKAPNLLKLCATRN